MAEEHLPFELSDTDGNATVVGNTVVNAVYDPVKYTVMFADAAGGVFSTQQVAYGEAADLPEDHPSADGLEFVAWDTSAGTPWWNVTENMIVKPLFAYGGTVSTPFAAAEIASGYVSPKAAKVYLETATEGSAIYYTTDGTDPVVVDSAALDADVQVAFYRIRPRPASGSGAARALR